ncbi:uncharacterized protein [Rutidosis leptorrhynchoides]|uniref:uncharacterized protein n=1 Tax=Rutidosis leptorrhynchoides TaxID=125765 RepID=UPI003A998FDA
MWVINLHSTFMGIDLNKDIMSKLTSSFNKFSIRGYVVEIRKQDPKKCWPFGSLGDPYNNEFFNSYEFTESNVGVTNIEEDHSNSTTSVGNDMVEDSYNGSSGLTSSGIHNVHENSVNEGPKNGRSVAADHKKRGENRPMLKRRKTRLLIDIYNDSACHVLRAPRDGTNHVNKMFAAEIEDELSNDVTFDDNFNKRKGIEVTDLKIKKKRSVRYEQPIAEHGKKSKRGFKETIDDDSEAGSESHLRKKLRTAEKQNAFLKKKKRNRTEATKSSIEDSEIKAAAIMLTCLRKEANISVCENMLRAFKINAGRTFVQPKFLKRSKKIRKRSVRYGNSSVKKTLSAVSKSQVVSADVHKKFTNEKAVQIDDDDDGLKGTTCAGPMRNVKICESVVCLLNMNPADFSFLEDDNEFMRD